MSDIFRKWQTEHGDTVEVYVDADEQYRWRVKAAGNNEVVGQGEAHTTPWPAIEAAQRHHPPVDSAG